MEQTGPSETWSLQDYQPSLTPLETSSPDFNNSDLWDQMVRDLMDQPVSGVPQVPPDAPVSSSPHASARPRQKPRRPTATPRTSAVARKRKTTEPQRESNGRFQRLSTPPTESSTTPTASDRTPLKITLKIPDKENVFYPMPTSNDISCDLIDTLIAHSSSANRSPLAKIAHDLMLHKRYKPLFIEFIDSILDRNQPLSYINLNLVMSECLKHFGFL
jgi:hypothetical protein